MRKVSSLALLSSACGEFQLVALGSHHLDLLDSTILPRMLVVNAAAYTAAESERKTAFTLNCHGAAALAAAARARGCAIVHLSTDYVFDGTKTKPMSRRIDPIRPACTGDQNLQASRRLLRPTLILRTAWFHAPYGQNFLLTMLPLARERPQLAVVADQYGNPTYAPHLADAIQATAAKLKAGTRAPPWGVYHAAAGGETTGLDLQLRLSRRVRG